MTPRRKYTAADWIAPAGCLVIFLIGLAIFAACQSTKAADPPPETKLQAAVRTCGLDKGRVADGGHTLTLDTQGNEDATGDSAASVGCVLTALGVPTSVTAHMDQTRALDGMQTDEWSGVKARWTFHPNVGMTLILTA